MGRVASRKPPAPSPTGHDWSKCAIAVRQYDSSIVTAWVRDMDASITFAALFSVVNAAFLSESYKWLRTRDRPYEFSVLGQNPLHGLPYHSQPSDRFTNLIINGLWIASFIIALNAVVMATLVKQWLAEYTWALESRSGSSQEILALRQVRFNGFNTFKLPQIIDYLPLQIIFAVFLFFAGIVQLAWTLDIVLGIVATVLVGISACFFGVTSILPTFFPTCFSRSPQAWLVHHFRVSIMKYFQDKPPKEVNDWSEILLDHVQNSSEDIRPEADALHWMHGVLASWDSALFPSIWRCALSFDDQLSAKAVCTLYENTASHLDTELFTEEHAEKFCRKIPGGYDLLEGGHKVLLKAFPQYGQPAEFVPDIQRDLVAYAKFLASTLGAVHHDSEGGYELRHEIWMDDVTCLLGIFDPFVTPLAFLTPREQASLKPELITHLESFFIQRDICSHVSAGSGAVTLLQTTFSGASAAYKASNWETFPFLSVVSVCLFQSQSRDSQAKYTPQLIQVLENMISYAGKRLQDENFIIWLQMLDNIGDDAPWDQEGDIQIAFRKLLQAISDGLVLESSESRARKKLFGALMEWGSPEMIVSATVAEIKEVIASETLQDARWLDSVGSNATERAADILQDATSSVSEDRSLLLLGLCAMVIEPSTSSFPSQLGLLRHIIVAMLQMDIDSSRDRQLVSFFSSTISKFFGKKYTTNEDGRWDQLKIPESLRGQVIWSVDNLAILAHKHATEGQSEDSPLFCAYAVQFASTFAFLYPDPTDAFQKASILLTDMRNMSQVVGNSKSLSALKEATEKYVELADNSPTSFKDAFTELLDHLESQKPPTAQKRTIRKIREYLSSMV
ncbi:hypothetical protein C8J56DRAFT_1088946 [Mycena floridula]|nr:hypothetical protein C8J56DRAFT_1088946 [Mycena floridula]